jgi:hypothetical protein
MWGCQPNGFHAQFLGFDGRDLDYDFWVTKKHIDFCVDLDLDLHKSESYFD